MFNRMDIVGKQVGIPTTSDIRTAENFLGLSFPPSYVDWVTQFGYGTIDGLVSIWVPTKSVVCDNIVTWSPIKKQLMRESSVEGKRSGDDFYLLPDGTIDLVERLVPFGATSNGSVLAWDPLDQRGAEYAIYVNGDSSLGYRRCCYGLTMFMKMLFGEGASTILGDGMKPRRPIFSCWTDPRYSIYRGVTFYQSNIKLLYRITPNQLDHFERDIGYFIPSQLRDFYCSTNGGKPDKVDLQTGLSVDVFIPLFTEESLLETYIWFFIDNSDVIVDEEWIPFALDPSKNIYAINNKGDVRWFSARTRGANSEFVAGSLNGFIDALS